MTGIVLIVWLTSLAAIQPSAQASAAASTCTASRFVDPRDGSSYPVMTIGDGCWFLSNLRFDTNPSFCYDDEPANCFSLGRLYPWEAALSACPTGWHLATEYDWQNLEEALGVRKDELEKTRERGIAAGDRFKALHAKNVDSLYAGWRRPDGKFSSRGKAAGIWVANDTSRELAWHRDFNIERKGIFRSEVNKPYALSVRCVKNYFENDPSWEPEPGEQ